MSDDELRVRVYSHGPEPVKGECPTCGEFVPVNEHDCPEEPTFDGVCAMCGARYRSYLDHLKECPAGE